MVTEEEIININFGEVGMYLPRSTEAIQTARKLLDMLETQLKPQIRSENDCTCNHPDRGAVRPQGGIGAGKELTPEVHPTAQKPIDYFQIPKFAWDKTKEKNYDKLFFFEEGDKVMLSYMTSKCFVSKTAVLRMPFPVPRGYALLKDMTINKKTGIRVYRKYLNEMVGSPAPAKDDKTPEKREEELRKKAEINKARWESKQKQEPKEMSARTKELRDNVVAKMVYHG